MTSTSSPVRTTSLTGPVSTTSGGIGWSSRFMYSSTKSRGVASMGRPIAIASRGKLACRLVTHGRDEPLMFSKMTTG